MKNLITYLSKKSLSLGNGSGMTRKWFGNDSGMTRLCLASLICLCMLTIGSGNVWGADQTITITRSSFSASSGGYAEYTWSADGISGAAKTYPDNATEMQFNNTNRGLWNTTPVPGRIKSVTITTSSGTARTYVVRGATTAFDASSTNSSGTAIGSGQAPSTSGTTYTVTGSNDFRYFLCYKSGSGAAYLASIVITYEEEASCSASPTVGNAANNGALVYSTSPMTVPVTCPSIGAGSSCEIKDYGFVWKAGGNPTIANNKTQIGTDNHSTAFSGNISGTFAAGTTYYVKAYAINNGDNTTLSTGNYSFTPRSITFNSNGGSPVATILVLSGTAASQPADPTKDGYTFGGWYTDSGLGTAVNWSSNITSNKTYYAKWIDLPKYTVTLKDNDETLTQASAGAAVTLPSRTGCAGYTFAGWTKTWVAPQSSWTTTAPTIIPAGSYTPTANENLYPVYTKTESGGSTSYVLTAANAVTAGTYVIGITGSSGYYIATGLTGSTNVDIAVNTSTDVTLTNNAFTTLPTGGMELTFTGNNTDGFTISNSGGDKLSYSSYANRRLSFDATGKTWKVIEDDSKLVLQSNNSDGYYTISQNGTNSIRGYASNTKYNTLYLFKKTGGSTTSYISVPACCTDWSTPTVTYATPLAINASEGVTISSGTVHGSVSYESSDEDVLTVAADGTITAVGAGTAHIIATWAGDATYCEKSANSNDVTVSGIQVTGTTPVNFGQVYQNAVVADKTIYVTGLGLASAITPSLPAGSPFSFIPGSLAANASNATLTISASTATIGDYNQTLTLTSGTFTATVTVKMEVIAKPTATFVDGLHSLTVDKDGIALSSYNLEAAQGTPVVFPILANQTKSAGTCEGEYYRFVGWTTSDNNTDPEDHLVTSHTLANGDAITYHAVWADGTSSASYTKLTTDAVNTSKNYVIGAESGGDTYYLYEYRTKWGGVSTSEDPIVFTVSGTASALKIKDGSNNYIEPCSSKTFTTTTTAVEVALDDDGTIHNTGTYSAWNLRFNPPAGTQGLRWYDGTTGSSAYLYEVGAAGTVHYRTSCCADKVDAPVVTASTVTSTSITLTWPAVANATGYEVEWNGAGGWVAPTSTRTYAKTGLTPNTTYTWKVRATYTSPQCGADVRSGSTTTNPVYHVTYLGGSGTGSCSPSSSTTDATGYEAGATVTLQSNGFSLSGHTFNAWTEDDPDVTISSNQFTMPDHDVVITATWTPKVDKYFDRMHDQTDASHDGVVETSGTNEGKYYIPKEGCNYSVPTAVDRNTGDACQTSHYKLQGWIAASYMKGYPNNMTGEIGTGNEVHIFPPTGTKTATGATYYAIWAEVSE